MISTESVRTAARGKWISQIFPALCGGQLDDAMKVWNPRGSGGHVACPVHGGRNGDAFRLFPDADQSGGGICNSCGAKTDGFEMLLFLFDMPKARFFELKMMVAGVLGLVDGVEPAPVVKRLQAASAYPKRDDEKIKHDLNTVWDQTIGIGAEDAEPARKWAAYRKLPVDLWAANEGVVRFHPSLSYYDRQLKRHIGDFPAICCLFFHEGRPFTIHRTYITEEGERAPVAKFRKVMEHCGSERITGGYIPIGDPIDGYVGFAEGLETATRITTITGLPCWPTTSWTHMQKVSPPRGQIQSATFWTDKDRNLAGQRGAEKGRLFVTDRGIKSSIEIPPFPIPDWEKGIDWDDVGKMFGRAGFPEAYLMDEQQAVPEAS
jgi:hypothetical protein